MSKIIKCGSCGHNDFQSVSGDYGIIELNKPINPNSLVFPVNILVCKQCETVILKAHSKSRG